eukprot:scaffold5662_cov57-Attheya_sp.AAC.2
MTEESWETIGLDHQRNSDSVLPSISMYIEEQYFASVIKVTERGVKESSAILEPERRADLRACVSEILA